MVHTGDMGNTLASKGFWALSMRPVSWSKDPRSYCMKLTSQILSATSLMPTGRSSSARPPTRSGSRRSWHARLARVSTVAKVMHPGSSSLEEGPDGSETATDQEITRDRHDVGRSRLQCKWLRADPMSTTILWHRSNMSPPARAFCFSNSWDSCSISSGASSFLTIGKKTWSSM